MAGRPLRPATDRRLGRPLPHQQANRTQATPKAPHGFGPQPLSGISPSFPGLFPTFGQIPTRYSPVRHSPCGACDLHVLSIPPAFALSQDQTLRFIFATQPKPGHADAFRSDSAHHSRCKALSKLKPQHMPYLRDSTSSKAESACVLPKDRCNCQRTRLYQLGAPSLARPRVDKEQPRIAAGQKPVPEGTKIRVQQPSGPQSPNTINNTQRRHRPARKEQPPRYRAPDLALASTSFRPAPGLPPKPPPQRRITEVVPLGTDFKAQSPRPFWKQSALQRIADMEPLSPNVKT